MISNISGRSSDIAGPLRKPSAYSARTRRTFSPIEQYQNSCAFSMIQIGERVKRVSKEVTSKYDTVEWRELAGFRDILSHNYGGVNLHMVWKTITTEIPLIKKECESILADLKRDRVL